MEAPARIRLVPEATVITVQLEEEGVMRLAERLRRQSRQEARIISRAIKIYVWTPDRLETHILPNGLQEYLYLWMIKTGEEEHPAARSAPPELYAPHKPEG